MITCLRHGCHGPTSQNKAERFTEFFQNSLEQSADGIFMPPIFVFSPGLNSFVPHGSLGTEVNVPIEDLEDFMNQSLSSINRGLQEAPQALILSLRFVGSSKHLLANSYGRDSVAMEVLGLGERQTVKRWASEMRESFPRSRMHWGLEQYGLLDSRYVRERYPEGFQQLQRMRESYDPKGLLETPYVKAVLT